MTGVIVTTSLYEALIKAGYVKTSLDNENDDEWANYTFNSILENVKQLEIKLEFAKEVLRR